MRGLTPAERAELARFPIVPTGELVLVDDPSDAVVLEALASCGRMSVAIEPDRIIYTPSDAGRLALRLWPAAMATPGAGGA